MTTHFEAIIDETAADRPGLEARRFNQLCLKAPSLEGLIDALKERYGLKSLRLSPTNGVYIDTKDGETRRIGFTRSYWNRDDPATARRGGSATGSRSARSQSRRSCSDTRWGGVSNANPNGSRP